jgi:succinoglycan biosynthesis transport protein ExoP
VDLSDYLLLLRRGWTAVVAFLLLGGILAAGYLLATPKTYQAATTLLVTPDAPADISAAATGTQLAGLAAPTYAGVINSPAVLETVAGELSPQIDVGTLSGMISAGQRPGTSLIDIVVTGNDPRTVADVANVTADVAASKVPEVVGARSRSAALVLERINVAAAPATPVSPVARSVIAIGLIIGLVAGIGVAIARQALDTRIRSAQDIKRWGGGVLLGDVTISPKVGLLPTGEAWGRATERFRALRTNLAFGRGDDRRSVLLAPVRTTATGHLVAANLASSIAQTGRTVLLIDADLRSAPMNAVFGITGGPTLLDVLMGRTSLRAAIVPHQETLSVLPASGGDGATGLRSSDLLSSPAMGGLIAEAERGFDHVIVSGPPLLTLTDSSVIAQEVRATVLTIPGGRTTFTQLAAASSALGNVGVTVVGSVLVEHRRWWSPGRLRRSSGPRRDNRYREWRALDRSRSGRA